MTIPMDADLRRRMLAYYDARAAEYEEAYTLGTGTTSIRDPEVFRTEAQLLAGVVSRIVQGEVMDLACGTAYWMPNYAASCHRFTLFDQSAGMLAEARAKADRLGILARCTFLQGDFFEYEFEPGGYDSVVVGFFLSHLTEAQESTLFDALRKMLRPAGRFLILDSAWSPARAEVNAKVERQPRSVNDGTAFEIFKRYCDRDDISRWARDYDVQLRIEYFGSAFLAVTGTFDTTAQ